MENITRTRKRTAGVRARQNVGVPGRGSRSPIRRTLDAEIDRALQQLQPSEEQILRLRYGIGGHVHDCEEVAQHVGMDARQLRLTATRALQKLRALAVDAPPR